MTISLLALLAAALPASALDNAALAEHIRETYNVPGAVEITVGTPAAAGVPGFKKAAITFKRGESSQQDAVWVSDNGKHYLLGGFKDLTSNPDQERLAKLDLASSASRGPKKAPVTVVQYTDFECPFCQKGYEIMQDKILKEFPGKVRWVYKSLPLNSIHPMAEPAAMGAECAKLQGEEKFWKVHDALFAAQRELRPDTLADTLAEYVKAAGGDVKTFEACYESKKTLPQVAKDAAEAESLGISGTPAFLVNGHLVSGADYATIKRLVEEALQGRHGKS
jgi:protein-disulfide isomerase